MGFLVFFPTLQFKDYKVHIFHLDHRCFKKNMPLLSFPVFSCKKEGLEIFLSANWFRNRRKQWKHRQIIQKKDGIAMNRENLLSSNEQIWLMQKKKKRWHNFHQRQIRLYQLVDMMRSSNTIQKSFFSYTGVPHPGLPVSFLSFQLSVLPLVSIL